MPGFNADVLAVINGGIVLMTTGCRESMVTITANHKYFVSDQINAVFYLDNDRYVITKKWFNDQTLYPWKIDFSPVPGAMRINYGKSAGGIYQFLKYYINWDRYNYNSISHWSEIFYELVGDIPWDYSLDDSWESEFGERDDVFDRVQMAIYETMFTYALTELHINPFTNYNSLKYGSYYACNSIYKPWSEFLGEEKLKNLYNTLIEEYEDYEDFITAAIEPIINTRACVLVSENKRW